VAAGWCLLLTPSTAAAQTAVASADTAERSGVSSPGDPTTPFQSDGCTWWFDGDHKACCVQHDLAYARSTSWRDRLRADGQLCGCIWRTPGWWHKPMAPVMWTGVHVVHRGIRPLLHVLHLRRSAR
jgi:hypothetical protein